MKKLLKKYQKQFFFLLLFPLIWCLAETIAPYLIKILIDRLGEDPTNTKKLLLQIALGYIGSILLLELSTRGCSYLWIQTFPKIRSDVQALGLSTIQEYSFKAIRSQFAGNLISRYRNLFENVERLARILLYGFYPTYLSFFISLALIATISPLFAGVFSIWFIAMNGITALFLKKSLTLSEKQAQDQNKLVGHVGNLISNAILMITYPQKYTNEALFKDFRQQSFMSTKKMELITFYADSWRSFFSWLLMASMITFLCLGWQASWITLGDFSFIGAVCFYIRRSIWMGSTQLLDFFKETGQLKDSLSLFKESVPSSIKSSPLSLTDTAIDIKEASFSYDGITPIFNRLSLSISPNEKIGISGSSGAGKTSLIYLLFRLYDLSEGSLSISGIDIQKFPLDQLRSIFSYVPQNAPLLHRSIFENIAFGTPQASREEVLEAGAVCQCDSFVKDLENGYDTTVGEQGFNLSGGQRQRIAIARAFLKKAPIFILDEATSGLETSLEEKLLESFLKNLKNHTVISISHRSSVLKKMDQLIEIKNGKAILKPKQEHLCVF